jgi:Kef-type K+ transport system membrane component KefB
MWQVFTLVILFCVMAAMSLLPGSGEAVNLINATGFLMLAAFTMGELFRRINLPALLGYIIAGLVFGPDIMELVAGPDAVIELLPRNITDADKLAYIEILTIGVIGTLGGGELNWEDLRDQFGSILKLNLLVYLTVVPATGLAIYLLAGYAPDVVSFIYEVDLPAESSRISAAVLMGILGFAMSPAATLAIIQENRSEGRFTSFVLGAVIVAELLLVATFLVGKSFSSVLLEQGSFALQPLLASLPAIGAEFGWAIVIGAVTGLVFILYFRFVSQEMIVFTVGAFFVASYACEQLHAERLLAFITAGFIVQNFSRHGHDMIEALERISLPVFVIYFALQAVDLNLMGIPKYTV